MSFAKQAGLRAFRQAQSSRASHIYFFRTYSSATYEHILTSTPKPGVAQSPSHIT